MRSLLVVVAIAGCGSAQRTGGGGGGGQTSVSAGPIPGDVRKAVDAIVGAGARITSEREGGVTIYEAAIETKLEIELSSTGVLQQTEVALPVATLPTAVAAALAGKGKISEAEVVVRPTGVAFEVEIGDTEYVVDATGKILDQQREVEDGKDDDD
ncbi:MAG TPA: hypothetical protein VIV40_09890 [Kofleriaceae bacterium]